MTSDIPRPTTTMMPAIIQQARVRCPQNREGVVFRESGLAYSIKLAEQARRKFRHSKNKQDMAKYADVVTVAFTDFIAPLQKITLPLSDEQKKRVTATTIANCCYIALFAQDAQVRTDYDEILKQVY